MLPSKRYHAGFTLVELVATVILLSVLGVVAYTKFPSFSGFTVPAYCAAAKSAIRRVQTQAMNDVTSTSPYMVIVNPTNIEWKNDTLALNSSRDCVGSRCSNLVEISDADVKRGIRFAAQQVTFDSLGRSITSDGTGTQTIKINIDNPQGSNKEIVIYNEGYVDGCD